MKVKKLADEIVASTLSFALDNQDDADKRAKAYRKAARELLEIADAIKGATVYESR